MAQAFDDIRDGTGQQPDRHRGIENPAANAGSRTRRKIGGEMFPQLDRCLTGSNRCWMTPRKVSRAGTWPWPKWTGSWPPCARCWGV